MIQISADVVEGALVLTMTGRMDSNNYRELAILCQDSPKTPVIIDMLQVEYINSAALRGLLEFNRHLQSRGTRLLLVELKGGFTDKILHITGFKRVFDIASSVPEAHNALLHDTGSSAVKL